MTAPPARVPVVAVIGGGASGTLTAVHLLRHAAARGIALDVTLIDRDGRHGLGQAYATSDPCHLLNACAEKMSGVGGDPDHFVRWLGRDGAEFAPRAVYGHYLRELLADAHGWTLPGGGLTELTGTVTAVTRHGETVAVRLSDGGAIEADVVVLATGNRAPSAWPQIVAGARYVADPWAPGALAGIRDGAPVVILGTGLTMVDVAVTVTRAHPDTVVYAVSRHGLLPRSHPCPSPPPAKVASLDGVSRLGELLAAVRAMIDERDGEWHGVVDGLRCHVPELWARLSLADRRRFLALVSRYWEVHRHRIPPATYARITALRQSGRLQVLRGRLESAEEDDHGLTVRLEDRELRAGWLVNGTGSAADVATDPLLRALFGAGTARPDPLRLGLDADANGAVIDGTGRPNEQIFTLGPPLRGIRYETTAIPEIRDQAFALAPRLLRAACASPGHALMTAEIV